MIAPRLQIDGATATAGDLAAFVFSNYGAFTSMQVEDGAVRGLDLHLERLEREAVELFGVAVPPARLRALMRRALDGRAGRFSLRVNLFSDAISVRAPAAEIAPRVLVAVSAPAAPLDGPLRLQTQAYVREAPHLKHAATFGLTRAARAAARAGFDDALFVGPDGRIGEGSIWNIGFIAGDEIIWPEAPMLAGVGQALIQRGLAGIGLSGRAAPVSVADLAAYDGAFVCNSATPACAVASVDAVRYPTADAVIARLTRAWASNPAQPI